MSGSPQNKFTDNDTPHRYSARNKPLVKPMLALALCAYALAVISWALDIRILWNDIYRFLPLQLSADQVDDYNAVLMELNGALLFTQVVMLRFIVRILCGNPCQP